MELKGSQSMQLVSSPCPESLRTFWQLWEVILYWKVIFRLSGSPKSTFWHHRGICKMTNFQTLPAKIEVSAVKSLEFGLCTLRVVYSIKFSACFDKFEVLFGWGKHPPISLTFVTILHVPYWVQSYMTFLFLVEILISALAYMTLKMKRRRRKFRKSRSKHRDFI